MAELSRTKRVQRVDLHVGLRVRARRRELRLSMEALGCELGVTYQQVQKYEKGANRISASMLYEIAAALETPVAYFYDGLADRPADDACYRHRARADAVAATPGGANLLDAYLTLSPRLRAPLVQLVCRMAGGDAGPQPSSERDVQIPH